MKILLLAKTLSKGGAASGARNLLGALEAAGAEVVACAADELTDGKPVRMVRTAERVIERLFFDAETHCLRFGPASCDLGQLYARHKPDIIQICDVSGNTLRFGDIARLPCPIVHRMSDFWPYNGAHHYAEHYPTQPSLADRLLRMTNFDGHCLPDHRVAPSKWLADCLGGGEQISIIRNAVEVPADMRPRQRNPGTVTFGFISNSVLDPRKGFVDLPVLLAAHFAQRPDQKIILQVFGKAKAADLPAIPGVELRLNAPFGKDDLDRVYGSFDILLCPSVRDNSPNVVTEALARGVPVIARAGTGIDSYVTERTGYLVDFSRSKVETIGAFSRAVNAICSDPTAFSMAARDYARQELLPKVIGARYLDLYRMLIARSAKAGFVST